MSNGSTISLEELRVLLPPDVFPDLVSLERYLRTDGVLSRDLAIRDGEVTLATNPDLATRRRAQRELTTARLLIAERFVGHLARQCPWLELVGISGSTAFGGAKPQDDVDFFLVTRKNRMWITLLIAMSRARILRIRSPEAPVFCFNRVTEIDDCARSFREARDPLFAREALSLKVLLGGAFHLELLRQSPWMGDHFPELYRLSTLRASPDTSDRPSRPAAHWFLANEFAFLALGPYLWLVGLVRNARLKRQGRQGARFRTVVERSFCAYESRKYEELGDAYRRTF
jgi:hypothetical protein